ncbi:MAG TPA: hypothetical protein VJ022_04070 [Anaerolineales bacterium]|nr:hypothetical protein [Anaerolineales bacterium]
MFSRYELAQPSDEEELRRILRESPFAGSISISLEREPNYFLASAIEGAFHQTLAVRESNTGEIIGMGDRSVRPRWVNGRVQDVGYFSGLRGREKYRQGLAAARFLSKGFEGEHEQHKDGRAKFYLLSIIADNDTARRILASNLPHYPRLHPYRRMFTYAIRPTRLKKESNIKIKRGSLDLIPAILDCLARYGTRTQFAPHWTTDTLLSALTPALSISDFFLALSGDRVIGCLALWDQQSFKQSVIRGYAGTIARFRKLINLLSPLGGWPVLPEVGARLNHCFACFLAVDNDDPEIFSALLRALHNETVRRKYDYFMLGLAEGNPFHSIAKSYRPITYESQIYLVAWEDGYDSVAQIDSRPPALEIALL